MVLKITGGQVERLAGKQKHAPGRLLGTGPNIILCGDFIHLRMCFRVGGAKLMVFTHLIKLDSHLFWGAISGREARRHAEAGARRDWAQ